MAERYVLPITRLCVWVIRGRVVIRRWHFSNRCKPLALLKPLALSNSNKRVGGRTVGGTDRGRTVGGTDSGTDSGGTDRTSGFLVKRLKGGSLPALVAGFDNAVDSLAFGMNEVATEHFRLFTGSGYKLKCYPRTA